MSLYDAQTASAPASAGGRAADPPAELPARLPSLILPAGLSPEAVVGLGSVASRAADQTLPPMRGPMSALQDLQLRSANALAEAHSAAMSHDWGTVRTILAQLAGDCVRLYAFCPDLDETPPPVDAAAMAVVLQRVAGAAVVAQQVIPRWAITERASRVAEHRTICEATSTVTRVWSAHLSGDAPDRCMELAIKSAGAAVAYALLVNRHA